MDLNDGIGSVNNNWTRNATNRIRQI